MPELKFAELIDGVVYMPSSVTSDHGRHESSVVFWLASCVVHTPACDTGSQGTWLMLQSAPQPDTYLWVLPEYSGQSTIQANYHVGAPELVAEICLTSAAYDLGVKKTLYQAAGVREYVAVIVEDQDVRWHRLVKGEYQLCRPTSDGIVRPKTFPSLWLDAPVLGSLDLARLLHTLERGLESAEHAAFVKKLAAHYSHA